MIEIELDGKKVSVPPGSMVMHAADAADTYICLLYTSPSPRD